MCILSTSPPNTHYTRPTQRWLPSSQSLIDDIINAVNEVLYRCTDSFETGLLSADPALLGFADRYAAESKTAEKDDDGNDVYPEARLEIEEGVLKLETLMENAVDKNFDRLEIWTLRNVLCLPRGEEELGRWVRLGHYEVREM
jgi:kinetochore protein Mis12/MTW1